MVATTWDTLNKSAGVTLSGGNLTATITASTSQVQATRKLSQATYFECKANVLNSSMAVGLCNQSYSFSGGTLLGADNNGIGYRQNGAVVLNGVTLSTIQTFAQGDTVCIAVDPVLRMVWFRTNAGNWNNSGTANPATGVGGIDYSTMSLTGLFPCCGANTGTPNQAWIATFTAPFAQTVPSGFSSIDTVPNNGEKSSQGTTATSAQVTAVNEQQPGATHNQRAFQLGRSGSQGSVLWSPAGVAKTISGIVTESGLPAAKPVRIYDRLTGQLIAQLTSSAVDGSFSFPGLPALPVYVVSLDSPFNALIFDAVNPV